MKTNQSHRSAALVVALLTSPGAFSAEPSAIAVNDQVTFRVGNVTAAPGQTNVSLPIYIEVSDWALYINEYTFYFLPDRQVMGEVSVTAAKTPDQFTTDLTYDLEGMPIMSAVAVQSAGEPIDFSKVLAADHQGVVGYINFCVPRKAARGSFPVSLTHPNQANQTVTRFTGIRNCPDSPTLLCSQDFMPLLLPGLVTITGHTIEGDDCSSIEIPRDPVTFSLGAATAAPGESSVTVPLSITVGAFREITSFEALIQYDPAVLGGVTVEATRPFNTFKFRDQSRQLEPGTVWMEASYELKDSGSTPLTAADCGEVARLTFCVLTSAASGPSPLTIVPLAHTLKNDPLGTDYNSISQNLPMIKNGKVTVAGEPVAGGDCLPDIRLDPVQATFRLGDADGSPGGEVVVPLFIDTNQGVPGYSFSVDFDEEVLQATRIEKLFPPTPHQAMEFEFEVLRFDNSNLTPGNGGVDEGYLVGAVIFGASPGTMILLPPSSTDPVLAFHFKVNPNAPAGAGTEIRFLDGARSVPENPLSQPVRNVIVIGNQSARFDVDGSYVHIDGRIGINGDAIVFIRGDTNRDLMVDLSDAVMILGFLFLANESPSCLDAADVTDDSQVDVSDVVQLLSFLYLDGSQPIAAPYPSPGKDPTPDGLPCVDPEIQINPSGE